MIIPATSTTSWSRFPPLTREVQFDEKWSFVAKKEKNCDETDPADDRKGDTWDHVAIDAESRLIVSVVPGERTAENVVAVVDDFKQRTGGRLMNLITTDGYLAYEQAILDAYGETITPPRTGKRGRPKASYKVAPKGLTYAVVEKTREKGRVVSIATRVVFGTMAAVIAALGMSKVSRSINTSFVERQNGTDRHRNARKARKTYRFSKDWRHQRIGDLSDDVCVQFLLAGSDLTDHRRPRHLAEEEPGHGGRAGRSRLVNSRMAGLPIRATLIGHEGASEGTWKIRHQLFSERPP